MGDPLRLLLTNAAAAGVIALVAWAGSRVLRRHAVIHALWLLALVRLVCPPLAPLPLLPAWTAEALGGAHPAPAVAEVPAPLDTQERRETRAGENGAAAVREPSPAAARGAAILVPSPSRAPVATAVKRPRLAWPIAVWALLASGALAIAALATWRVRRFARLLACARPAPPPVAERAATLAARIGLRRAPAVVELPARIPPMLFPRPRGPLLLMPESLLSDLRAEELDTLLVHELAHVRRRDHWVRVLELAVTSLFWWYPVAWWARRALRRAEERCCDEWVLRVLPHAAQAYANALLKSLTFVSSDPLPSLASGLGPVEDMKERLKEVLMTRPAPQLALPSRIALAATAIVGLTVFPTNARPGSGDQDETTEAKARKPAAAAKAASDAPPAPLPVPASPVPKPPAPSALPPPVAPTPPAAGVGGVNGGVDGGVTGGVTGGVPGGVAGGVLGGVPGPAAMPMIPPAAPLAPPPALAPMPPTATSVPATALPVPPALALMPPPPMATPETAMPAPPPFAPAPVAGPMGPGGRLMPAPLAPVIAAPRQHDDPEHRALDEERRTLEDQRQELRQQELDLSRKKLELEAEAEQAELRAAADRLRDGGNAEEALVLEKRALLASRRMDLRKRELALAADRAALETKMETEIRAHDDRPEAPGREGEARALEEAQRAMETADAARRKAEQDVERGEQALRREMEDSESEEQALAAEERIQALRGATEELVRSITVQIASLKQKLAAAPAQRADVERIEQEVLRLQAALEALERGGTTRPRRSKRPRP